MCLLNNTCIICQGSMRTSFHIVSDIILWSVRLWFSFILSCPWLCLKSNSAFHKVLLLLDLCSFWSFSEHLQMNNFIHYLGYSRHLLFSSGQQHSCHLATAPQFWGGDYFFLLQEVLVDFILRWACDLDWPKSPWYLTQGLWEPVAVFLQHERPSVRNRQASSRKLERKTPAMWLETQDAVMPKVLTSVLRSVFCYLCLNWTNQSGPTCLPSRVILGL